MIEVRVEVDDKGARGFLVKLDQKLKDRRGFSEALGLRLKDELVDHFKSRRDEPNKMGAEKTGFWAQIAAATALTDIDESGATVSIADERVRVHIFGGTIKPTKRYLTIPLIPEARGERAAGYEKKFNKDLFQIPGVRLLFEKEEGGEFRYGGGDVRQRKNTITIARNTDLRAVYYLASSATIKQDKKALPDEAKVINALTEVAESWIELEKEGGLA